MLAKDFKAESAKFDRIDAQIPREKLDGAMQQIGLTQPPTQPPEAAERESDPVEAALGEALRQASLDGRYDVVLILANELQARREAKRPIATAPLATRADE